MDFLSTHNIEYDNKKLYFQQSWNYLKVDILHTGRIGNYKDCVRITSDIFNKGEITRGSKK